MGKLIKLGEIDLQDYQIKGSRVFTGRHFGYTIKVNSHINEIEATSDKVFIVLPENLGSINPSFLEEFIFDVVTKLKPVKFFEKFIFTNKGNSTYNITADLEEAVDRIMRHHINSSNQ